MRRLAGLDGVRGLAALYVVLHHAWLTIWPGAGRELGAGAPWPTGVLAHGHFAVAVFIVLSGFCLGLPVVRAGWRLPHGARGFLASRARRILPPYYAAVAFALLLIGTRIGGETGTHWDLSVPVDATGVAAALLLVQNVLGQSQINHVFWSIAVEAQIYLLFPALVLVCARRGLRTGVLAAAGAAGGLLALVTVLPVLGPVVLRGLTPQFLLLFALGVAAASVAATGPGRVPWGRLTAGGAAAFVLVTAALGREAVLTHLPSLDVLAGAVTACGLVALACRPEARAARVVGARPFAGLGRFAYSTYLVHAPVLQLFWLSWIAPLGLGREAGFALLACIGVPLSLLVSYGFFLLFERPFLARRPAAAPAGAPAPLPSGSLL